MTFVPFESDESDNLALSCRHPNSVFETFQRYGDLRHRWKLEVHSGYRSPAILLSEAFSEEEHWWARSLSL